MAAAPAVDAAGGSAEQGDLPPPSAPAKNAVYLEGLGAGLLYSINYERHVLDSLAVRAGLSYMSISAGVSSGSTSAEASATFLTFPITAAYVGIRGLEAGGGMTLIYTSASASTVGASASGAGIAPLGTLNVGYRLHPMDGAGFQFRIGAMAMIGPGLSFSGDSPDSIGVLPWIYLSLGAGFGA